MASYKINSIETIPSNGKHLLNVTLVSDFDTTVTNNFDFDGDYTDEQISWHLNEALKGFNVAPKVVDDKPKCGLAVGVEVKIEEVTAE